MRTLLLSIALFLTMTFTVAAGPEEACLKCHGPDAKFSLAGADVDELVGKMKAVRAGEVKHPPMLKDLSDEDLATIAAALSAG